MQPKKMALLARELASDKQAEDPILMDISKLSSLARHFLVVHGNSHPHVRAIADHIAGTLKKKHKILALRLEGG